MTVKSQITKSRVILVEGKDEVNFFNNLISFMGLSDIQIFDFVGKDSFTDKFCAFTKMPGFNLIRSIAIIRDADDDCEAAFRGVIGSIKHNESNFLRPAHFNLDYPSTPGNFFRANNINIGIFIMPNNREI